MVRKQKLQRGVCSGKKVGAPFQGMTRNEANRPGVVKGKNEAFIVSAGVSGFTGLGERVSRPNKENN